jgi:glycosyltransferase involved in cell wall biosynthesis
LDVDVLLEERGMSPPSTLVIVAALNEEQGIGATLEELRQFLGDVKLLVVDGRSIDRTVQVAKDQNADVIYQKGKGKGDAIACALDQIARARNVNYIVFTDADYTYPAEYLPGMIRILEEDPKIGMVCGNRNNHHLDSEAMRDIFFVGNRLLAFTHNLLNGVALRDPLTGLRVVRREILEGWSPKSKDFDIEVELNHHVERRGYRIAEVDIAYRPRLGQKKLGMKHGVVILKRILHESMLRA